jgi:hypothetical protein
MLTQLLLATVLTGQCTEHHTLVNTGSVCSKVYVRAVFVEDGISTEIPVINGMVPTVQMNRCGSRLDLIMDYRCGTIHKGGIVYLHRIDPPTCGTLPPPKEEKIAPIPTKNSEEKADVKNEEVLRVLQELNERVRRLEERPSTKRPAESDKVKPIPSYDKSA